MAFSKFESLWKFMSNHLLEIEGEPPPEVLCSICSNLMIEPYAAECNCQFCGKCIKEYLEEEVKKCPKVEEGCCDGCLEIDVNVFKDVRTNHIIKKVIVRCPNERCEVCTELEKMEEHFDNCCKRRNICPFNTLGCGTKDIVEISINKHMKEETVQHSTLLVETINEFRKKIDEIREIQSERYLEMYCIKEEGETNKKEIENHRNEIKFLKEEGERNKENIRNLKEELQMKEILINEMKDKINKLEETLNSPQYWNNNQYLKEFKKNMDIMGVYINELRDKESKTENMDIIEKKTEMDSNMTQCFNFENQDINIPQNEEIHENVSYKMLKDPNYGESNEEFNVEDKNVQKDIKKEKIEIKDSIIEGNTESDKLQEEKNQAEKSQEFVWRIPDLLEKIKKATSYSSSHTFYYSNPFYKDNYKLCLCCRITELKQLNSNLYFELYLVIMNGENDDKVEWPMKYLVQLSIINQTTSIKHKTGKYRYESNVKSLSNFRKLKKDINSGIGGLSISVKDINGVSGLLVEDTILVCCSLHSILP